MRFDYDEFKALLIEQAKKQIRYNQIENEINELRTRIESLKNEQRNFYMHPLERKAEDYALAMVIEEIHKDYPEAFPHWEQVDHNG